MVLAKKIMWVLLLSLCFGSSVFASRPAGNGSAVTDCVEMVQSQVWYSTGLLIGKFRTRRGDCPLKGLVNTLYDVYNTEVTHIEGLLSNLSSDNPNCLNLCYQIVWNLNNLLENILNNRPTNFGQNIIGNLSVEICGIYIANQTLLSEVGRSFEDVPTTRIERIRRSLKLLPFWIAYWCMENYGKLAVASLLLGCGVYSLFSVGR